MPTAARCARPDSQRPGAPDTATAATGAMIDWACMQGCPRARPGESHLTAHQTSVERSGTDSPPHSTRIALPTASSPALLRSGNGEPGFGHRRATTDVHAPQAAIQCVRDLPGRPTGCRRRTSMCLGSGGLGPHRHVIDHHGVARLGTGHRGIQPARHRVGKVAPHGHVQQQKIATVPGDVLPRSGW